MRWRTEGSTAATECVRQLCGRSGAKMCMSNCSGTFAAKRKRAIRRRVEIARKLQLPLLATNGVWHAQPQQREVLDVFTCIRHHRTLATAGRLLAAIPSAI